MTKHWYAVPISAFRLADPVFALRQEICSKVTIPSSLKRCEETGRLAAFRLDWHPGMPNRPHIYWDSDVAKVLEGMAYDVELHPDENHLSRLNELVDLICFSQQQDGYLNSYHSSVSPETRWHDLYNGHELYCAGHLMEAACACYESTGNRKLLEAVTRYGKLIAQVFGQEPGQRRGVPGHEEIELALCRLAEATGEKLFAQQAKYFVDERGQKPNFFLAEAEECQTGATAEGLPNRQAHQPVREQTEAIGHAVRAVYLYSGMAEVVAWSDDQGLLKACERLYDSIVKHKMYITGGIGSTAFGEAFTGDYNLPNDTDYAESCAAVGLGLFAWRMMNLTGEGRYADTMERVLYNSGLSGISLSGDRFFYANLLEVNNHTFEHGVTVAERQPWFTTSCCPTTYCRFLPQLGRFCWSLSEHRVRLHIPASGRLETPEFSAEVTGGYPYDGDIRIRVSKASSCGLDLRIPGWCRQFSLAVNGEAVSLPVHQGYVSLDRGWHAGDVLDLTLSMPVRTVFAHCEVAADAGRMALMRGPVVYCLEGMDNGHVLLHNLVVSSEQKFELSEVDGLPEGTVAIVGRGELEEREEGDSLYPEVAPNRREVNVVAIPYALWQNRGRDSMQVFMRYR